MYRMAAFGAFEDFSDLLKSISDLPVADSNYVLFGWKVTGPAMNDADTTNGLRNPITLL